MITIKPKKKPLIYDFIKRSLSCVENAHVPVYNSKFVKVLNSQTFKTSKIPRITSNFFKVLAQKSTWWKAGRQTFIIHSKYFAVYMETGLGSVLIPSINLVSTLDAWLFMHVSAKQIGYNF